MRDRAVRAIGELKLLQLMKHGSSEALPQSQAHPEEEAKPAAKPPPATAGQSPLEVELAERKDVLMHELMDGTQEEANAAFLAGRMVETKQQEIAQKIEERTPQFTGVPRGLFEAAETRKRGRQGPVQAD